jgi:flavin-dependent dehydrogenase
MTTGRIDPARTVADVAVIGGGPAGAAAALTLLKHTSLSVTLLERSEYDGWRVGESLSPGVLPLLAYLDAAKILDAGGHLPAHGTAASWGSREVVARDFLFTGRGQGWHVDRRKFDRELAALAAARGATLLTGTTVGRLDRAGRAGRGREKLWRIHTRHAATRAAALVRARHLIDASGRPAAAAKQLGARRIFTDQLVGLIANYDVKPGTMRDSFTVVEATPAGWWYSALLPGARLTVAFMSDPDIIRRYEMRQPARWNEAVAATLHTRRRVEGATLNSRPVIAPAFSHLLQPVFGPGWVAAGETAVGFDPLSAMGIGYALASGINAARAVHAALQGDAGELPRYAASVHEHYTGYLGRRAQFYQMEHRWPGFAFWRRRHPAAKGPIK